ncbi:MAG: NAD-dependent epimerase/dehydratase family protein [Candidatus Thiodiazotropha sp. (ex Myrtea sp. 'scaly one' KF741663)]|nr:NAD-dependent epimerase/dehydratase family protein [Candidatus Thiodiazotropha sp. (ex Myrtea sp. 'scaly one' KF741663)]
MKTIAILGASGYIGRHLVTELLHLEECRIKVLSRTGSLDFDCADARDRLVIFKGDLLSPTSLDGFFEANCTVVNLVYLWKTDEAGNLFATHNLLNACTAARVRRLIHCSTAAVVGRVSINLITENTIPNPVTEYGINKLKIEEAVINAARRNFDVVILRPTAVFGPGGEPLKKLASDLMAGNRKRNYLKSSLFGKRRMNLVHISNVVAAILFLIEYNKDLLGEIFIVSDDDNPNNNFMDIEHRLMQELHIPNYRFHFSIPLIVLKFLLICLGRNNVNPYSNYAPEKLLGLGFHRPMNFDLGLKQYARWYQKFHSK